MVSVLYKKHCLRLQEAYKEKPIHIHKDGTVEFILHYPWNNTYQVIAYGVNAHNVPFFGQVIEHKNKFVFYFSICGSYNEHTARQCAEHIDNEDELRKILYETLQINK